MNRKGFHLPLAHLPLATTLALTLGFFVAVAAPHRLDASSLVTSEAARVLGLERAWFSQAEVNRSRNHVVGATFGQGELVVLSSAGVLQTFDGETGKSVWNSRVGNPDYPSSGPAISERHLAVANGSTLYVYDRSTGREVMSRRVGGGVAGGPSLSESHVFVPLFSGRLEGYPLDNPRITPWYYTATGRIYQTAVVGGDSLVWSTDRSNFYGAGSDASGVRFRFSTSSPIVAAATIKSPRIFAASSSGYVYALDEQTGGLLWRYSTGFSVQNSPSAVAGKVLIVTQEPALHCLNAETGELQWVAAGVEQIGSVSKDHVYGLDTAGGLVALSAKTGRIESRVAGFRGNMAVLNEQTDRLYLVSGHGLVQCLHEIGMDEPYQHEAKTKEDQAPAEEQSADDEGDQPLDDPGEGEPAAPNPFDLPAEDDVMEQPADEPDAEDQPLDNPFGELDNPFG